MRIGSASFRSFVLASTSLATVGMAAGTAAQQPTWSLYNGGGYAIVPLTQAMTVDAPGHVNLQIGLNGQTASPTLDTGSTGIAISADKFTPDPSRGDQRLQNPGSITYTSGRTGSKTESGELWTTNVSMLDLSGNAVATSRVTILRVTAETVCESANNCTTTQNPSGIAFMGVGYDRGGIKGAPADGLNPLLNVVSLASGASASGLRPGYMIVNSGSGMPGGQPSIVLGLSGTLTQGFAFAKLTANGSGVVQDLWASAPATISVPGATAAGSMLPDSGVDRAFLTPPPAMRPSGTPAWTIERRPSTGRARRCSASSLCRATSGSG